MFSEKELGNGKFFFPNSGTYEGDFKEWAVEESPEDEVGDDEEKAPPKRVRHGKGTYSERGNTYTGDWVDDKMHGKGKFSYASKAEYEGDWVDNKYQGTGKYTWPDGSSYEVSFNWLTDSGDRKGSPLAGSVRLTDRTLLLSSVGYPGELGGKHPSWRGNLHRL